MKSSSLPCCVLPNFISYHATLPPVIAFSLSAPFLSLKQHISRTSLSISSPSISFTGCFTPYCCLCALCPIPLFPAAYLQDFSDDFRSIQSSVTGYFAPVVAFARSPPHSSLSSSISPGLLCRFSSISISVLSSRFLYRISSLSRHQHIFTASLPTSCLYIRYNCLLCFLLLPVLPVVTLALSTRFLSFQQHISMSVLASCFPS